MKYKKLLYNISSIKCKVVVSNDKKNDKKTQ